MTIETRKAANVNEALEILNSLLPNGTFVYDTENYSDDYKTTYRHFDATAQNGASCYGSIEFIENGILVKVRFVNIYRDTAVDIEIENFSAGLATHDNAIETKSAKKLYSINPVIDADDDIIFNRLAIYLTDNGALQFNGHFNCKHIETAYRRFVKAISQAANDIPQLKGWDNCWPNAKKITADSGSFFNENGNELFTNNDPLNTLAVDINEDTFYFFANFSADVKPLDGFNYDMATDYQHQTSWDNPHDFTVTGDLSDRNLYGRIIAANIAHEQEHELRELKADGINFLLKVKVPQMHPYRKFNFQNVIIPYKSLVALKKFGRNKIHDCNWRIETIDGKLIAKGNGVANFINFFNATEETTLTHNMILAQKITDKLGNLLVKFSHANEGNDGGLALHYDTFKDEHDEFGTTTRVVEVFTDQTNFILDHVNFITGYGDDKKVEKFFFKHEHVNAHMSLEELKKVFWSGHLPHAFETPIRAALKKASDEKRARLKKLGRNPSRLAVPQVNAILAKLLESGELFQTVQAQPPTNKQITNSLIRAIDKAKLEYKIAFIVGNQYKANFERELYLIATKALRELKH